MPTTNEEALAIKEKVELALGSFSIFDYDHNKVTSSEVADSIFGYLMSLIYNTDNYSLRRSIIMVYKLYYPDWKMLDEYISLLLEMYKKSPSKEYLEPYEYIGIEKQEYYDYVNRKNGR